MLQPPWLGVIEPAVPPAGRLMVSTTSVAVAGPPLRTVARTATESPRRIDEADADSASDRPAAASPAAKVLKLVMPDTVTEVELVPVTVGSDQPASHFATMNRSGRAPTSRSPVAKPKVTSAPPKTIESLTRDHQRLASCVESSTEVAIPGCSPGTVNAVSVPPLVTVSRVTVIGA